LVEDAPDLKARKERERVLAEPMESYVMLGLRVNARAKAKIGRLLDQISHFQLRKIRGSRMDHST
jgi:hypothetical protein